MADTPDWWTAADEKAIERFLDHVDGQGLEMWLRYCNKPDDDWRERFDHGEGR